MRGMTCTSHWIPFMALVLAACSSHRFYEGEARPRDEVAMITTAKSYSGRQLIIKEVDGDEQQTQTAEVLPGFHRIHVHATKSHYVFIPGGFVAQEYDQDQFDVTLRALAGHTYRLEWGDDDG